MNFNIIELEILLRKMTVLFWISLWKFVFIVSIFIFVLLFIYISVKGFLELKSLLKNEIAVK
tara:strand:- start:332 stop:517 length:186 start_codon:yes stop_codon:yes gene_type:complete